MNKKVPYFCLVFFSILFIAGNICLAQTKSVNDKNFDFQDNYWVDQEFDNQAEIIEFEYNSQTYQDLKNTNPEISAYLFLGENVKINFHEQNIVVTSISDYLRYAPDEDVRLYAWMIILVLAIFFVAVLVLFIISTRHKKQHDKKV